MEQTVHFSHCKPHKWNKRVGLLYAIACNSYKPYVWYKRYVDAMTVALECYKPYHGIKASGVKQERSCAIVSHLKGIKNTKL